MVDMNHWLGVKYGVQAMSGQAALDRAAAETLRNPSAIELNRANANQANAAGALSGAKAGQVPADAAAERGLKAAQAGLAGKQGGYYDAEAGLAGAKAGQVPADAAAERALRGAQGGYYGAETGAKNLATQQSQRLYTFDPSGRPLGGMASPNVPNTSVGSVDALSLLPQPGAAPAPAAPTLPGALYPAWQAYAHGTANVPDRLATPQELHALHAHLLQAKQGTTKVPGKGPSTVDTVPAVLAPREAVLNEHAADLIGRDKIAAANAIGVAHQKAQAGKGMPPAKGGKAHFAEGTDNVPQMSGSDPRYYQSEIGAMNANGGTGPGTTMQGSTVMDGSAASFLGDTRTPGQNGIYAEPSGVSPRAGGVTTSTPKPQKLAKGTHNVAPGKSAATPTKIDPQALIQLMQSMHAGQPGQPMPGMPPQQPPGGMV